jgi:hypothetical protein
MRLPLYTRGWVLQESFLSRRVLHMTKHHMLWQCRELFDQEDANVRLINQTGVTTDLSRVGFMWNRYRHKYDTSWWLMIEKYSRMELTYLSDKLPAVAGIIQYQSAKLQDTPLLGLWEKSLPQDLSWACLKAQIAIIPGIPSWTWLCSRGEVKKPPNLRPQSPMLELVDSSGIDWERQPCVSRLMRGALVVHTKTSRTILRVTTNLNDCVRADFKKRFLRPFRSRLDAEGPRTTLEYRSDISMIEQTPIDVEITYMLLYTTVHGERDHGLRSHSDLGKEECVVFLTLIATSNDPSAYIRVGCGNASLSALESKKYGGLLQWFRPGFREHVLRDWQDETITLLWIEED